MMNSNGKHEYYPPVKVEISHDNSEGISYYIIIGVKEKIFPSN